MSNFKSKDLLSVILLFQFVVCVTVFLDVPIARQVFGFIFYTFVPGFVIIKLFKVNKFNEVELVLFSLGFSIAFIMLSGLAINEIGALFGVSKPLSIIPLMLILNSFILVGGFLISSNSEVVVLLDFKTFKVHPLTLSVIGLPILSVIGAFWVNAFENNFILLILLLMIPLLFAIAVIFNRSTIMKLYPFIIVMIAIALLFHSSLISNYISTGDAHLEYFVFKTTENNAYWSSELYIGDSVYGRLNSMLSITIFPTVYSLLLNMDATWIFKIIYPLIFSFVPLGLYSLWQQNIGAKKAFISTFLFMTLNVYYVEMLGLARQMIAELFFILLLIIIFSKNINISNKMLPFTIFSFGLVTSHYALAEIFLFFISFTWISRAILKTSYERITPSIVILFFVIMFSWYMYTSNSAVFNSFMYFGDYIFRQLGDFFNIASRGVTVLMGLGLEAPPSMWNAIGRLFAYLTQVLIIIGFIGWITERVKIQYDHTYRMFNVLAMGLLSALILVPGLANTLNMTRFYHILLFFLAPFCIIGVDVFATLITKRRTKFFSSILLIILIPYFLFQTGYVYETVGVQSWSVPLSEYRMDRSILMVTYAHVDDSKASSALWLNKHIDVQSAEIYADMSAHELHSYGMIRYTMLYILSNTSLVTTNGVIYLNRLNVLYGKFIGRYNTWNASEFDVLFNNTNKVYTNSGSEIYKKVPS